MPSWVQNRPRLTRAQIRALDALYQKRLKSMLAVEETIDDIIHTLRETGQLHNTYIFFSSDNGFHLGQHRLEAGKNTEFEEDLHCWRQGGVAGDFGYALAGDRLGLVEV